MSRQYTRADVACRWTIHVYPGNGHDAPLYYVGPVHGRIAIAFYKTRAEAKIAIEIQQWIVKMFKLMKEPAGDR